MPHDPTHSDFTRLDERVQKTVPKEDFQRQAERLEAMAREVRDIFELRTKLEYQQRMIEGALNMISDIKEERLGKVYERISAVRETVSRLIWMGTGMGALISAGLVVLTLWLNHRGR
jgi:hypothetical protein